MVNDARQRQRGYTLVEVAGAFVVLSVIATTAMLSDGSQSLTIARALTETVAGELASTQLERLSAESTPLTLGVTSFEVPAAAAQRLREPRGTQTVKQLEPGLFEVTIEVSWQTTQLARRERIELTTLVTRKIKP